MIFLMIYRMVNFAMKLKTLIKNDMWRFNYIVPFVKKHQFDENGKVDLLKKIVSAYRHIHVVKADSSRRTIENDIYELLLKIDVDVSNNNRFIYFLDTSKTIAVPGNIVSNFTLDYDQIVHGAFCDIYKSASGDDEYGKAAELIYKGCDNLRKRIVEIIIKSSWDEEYKNKKIEEFNEMFLRPAIHFDEALQRILFFNQIMWQTRHRLNGLGRLDYILGDLYKKDLSNSYLTYNEAESIVYDFLCQLSRYSEYKSDALEGDIGQIIILGGLEADGKYFFNDLTKIFLYQQAKLKKPDPKTLLRVSSKMPDEILKISVECLKSATGSPLFSNDDRVIPILREFGMGIDAYNYCTSACWEPYIVGKSIDQNNVAVFDFFPALDEIMRRDKSYNSFNDFVSDYRRINDEKFRCFLKEIDKIKWAKDPLLSMFTSGCNEKRKDITEGNVAKYNNYGITTVAISNVVDSLLHIKSLVFDTKQYSLSQLNKIRMNNYEADSVLYEKIKNRKFFGHDEEECENLVNYITESMTTIAREYNNPLGGTVKFGLSSPGYNMLSKHTNADVAGRRRGMPYNTHISCMDATFTEICNFASKLKYDKQRFNGNVVDFFITPNFLQKNEIKFIMFLKGAIKAGFFQMQMNVMDSKTLIDAKNNPDKYPNLIVRVWGFSAYYNRLPENYKSLLIERALAAEAI